MPREYTEVDVIGSTIQPQQEHCNSKCIYGGCCILGLFLGIILFVYLMSEYKL